MQNGTRGRHDFELTVSVLPDVSCSYELFLFISLSGFMVEIPIKMENALSWYQFPHFQSNSSFPWEEHTVGVGFTLGLHFVCLFGGLFCCWFGMGGRGRRLSFLLLKPVEGEEQIGLCLERIFTDLKTDIRICIWRNLLPIAKRVCSSKPEFIEHDMQLTKSTLMVLCQNQGYGFCCDIAFFTEYATEWWEETLQLFVLTLWFAPLV